MPTAPQQPPIARHTSLGAARPQFAIGQPVRLRPPGEPLKPISNFEGVSRDPARAQRTRADRLMGRSDGPVFWLRVGIARADWHAYRARGGCLGGV